jgi:multiple sugar transport system permease protein
MATSPVDARLASRRRRHNRRRRGVGTALLFILPQLVGLIALTAIPLGVSLYYSFTKWDLVAPSPTWIGTKNWHHLIDDDRIPTVLWNTAKFIALGTTSFLVFSMFAALLAFTSRKGVGFYRALLFLPYVISQIAVGILWRWMLNSDSGLVDSATSALGLGRPDWLLDPKTAMLAIAGVTTWQGIGYGMTLYIAALQGIPDSIPEAATIDGVNAFQRFRYITLPLISPTVLFLTVTSLIGALQLFDPVVAMTTSGGSPSQAGGPDNSTRTVVLYMYNQMFNYQERLSGLGYAAAIAWMLALITFAFTIAQWVVGRRFVFYSGGSDSKDGE